MFHWKFNPENDETYTSHAFYNLNDVGSLCGRTILWFSNAKWSDDKEGLEKRKKCFNCVRIINRSGDTAPSSEPLPHDHPQAALPVDPSGAIEGLQGS